jgi:hypothetical protein
MKYLRLFFGASLAVILAASLIAGDDAPMPAQEKRVALRHHHIP